MSVRDWLNRNPVVSAGALALVILGAGYLIVYGRGPSDRRSNKSFYTVDEGATSFVDRANLEPPFDHDGHEAVRVHYFSCDGGKTRFVGWLEMYSPQAKAALNAAPHDADGNLKDEAVRTSLGWDRHPMVKRPGDPRWIMPHEREWYEQITTPKRPDGGDDNQIMPVEAR